MKSTKHRRIQPIYPYWLKGCCLTRPRRLDFRRNLSDEDPVELEHDSQIGVGRSGTCDVLRDGQIDGRKKRLTRSI